GRCGAVGGYARGGGGGRPGRRGRRGGAPDRGSRDAAWTDVAERRGPELRTMAEAGAGARLHAGASAAIGARRTYRGAGRGDGARALRTLRLRGARQPGR